MDKERYKTKHDKDEKEDDKDTGDNLYAKLLQFSGRKHQEDKAKRGKGFFADIAKHKAEG